QHSLHRPRPGSRPTRRSPLLPPGERRHALPQHDLSRCFPDRQRRRTLSGLPHRSRRRRRGRDPPSHARRPPALSRARLASPTGQSPIPRRLPLEHPETDIMKLPRPSDVAQALLPAVSRLVSTLVPDCGPSVGKSADAAARSADATRRGPQLLRVLLLLFLAAPGLSQSEDEPYFSLSSARTFGAGSKASVALTAWNVDTLEFRVYRVDDPVQFLQQLESAHEFGGRAPRPPHQRTWLERIHAWKHGLRTGIRLGLRGQFTESPSAHWERAFASANKPAASPAATGTHYAEAPLLNSQQLVLTFQHRPQSHNRWESQSVDVAVKDRGVYLVEAVRGELRAYTILMVSDLVMVTKNGNGRIVNFLAARNTGEPVRGAELVLLARDARQGTAESDANGLAELKFVDTKQDDLRLVARSGPNFAVNTLASYAFETSREHWTGYIYTDRPVYRPGHTVHFKGILRQLGAAGYTVPAGKSFPVEILDAEQKAVYRKTLTTTATGTIRDDFQLPPSAALGSYSIEVQPGGENSMNGSFEGEEYKKPEYEVRVTPTKARILQGENAQAAIDARYYFGEPVNGAKVKYAVYRTRYWFPMWYEPDDDSPPDTGDAEGNDYGDEQILDTEGQLDAEGKLTIDFPTTVSEHATDYRYRIEARVTDAGKREIVGRGSVIATYGSFVVNARPDRYFYQPSGAAAITVQARDYESKPVRTRIHVELFRWSWRQHSAVAAALRSADVD